MGLAVQISTILTAISAVIALAITAGIYWHGLRREVRLNTIKVLSALRNKYFYTKELSETEKLHYLAELEYFAVGVNYKLYDIKIVSIMSGRRLLSQYDIWMNEFIQYRRTRINKNGNSQPNAYSDIVTMMENLRKKERKKDKK